MIRRKWETDIIRKLCLATFFLGGMAWPCSLWAIVGQAEKYDEFKEADLQEFHTDLIREEKASQLRRMERMTAAQPVSSDEQKDFQEQRRNLQEEMELLKRELLEIPKRDLFRFGITGDYTFDSNINRLPPSYEKSDSVFDTSEGVEVDFSGKKTMLRAEYRFGKQWNIHFPKKNFLEHEGRLRYRRKYFKKITQSVQSSILRHSERTIEIDNKKIRWDSNQQTSINYLLSRKTSINLDLNMLHRQFTTDPFKRDSYWQAIGAPSFFWMATPKSRISAGYQFGMSRIRAKSGSTNAHEVRVGYFGKVTRKSSASLDIAYDHQTPKSTDTATSNTYTVGMGYIYQFSPKTQMNFQLIRALQFSTANLAPVSENADPNNPGPETIKQTTHFSNDSLSVVINYILTRRITTNFMGNASLFQSKTFKRGDKELNSRHFTFPVTWSLTYLLSRWSRLMLSYSFAYRVGTKVNQQYIDHICKASVNIVF
ncbi:MAG: hypothetical protein PHS88_11890 [Candidatus Omnitrophica bacterium]|nr:hypothetical protein [Candidatus Omnitrophota bacterium]